MNDMPTKERILYSALNLFAEKGYDGVGVDLIAENAGLKGSSLYRHYKGKEDIFNSLINLVTFHYEEGFGLKQKPEEFQESMDELIENAMGRIQFTMHDDIVRKTRRILAMEQFRSKRMAEFTTWYHLENLQQMYAGIFADLMEKGILIKDDPNTLWKYIRGRSQLAKNCYLWWKKRCNQWEKENDKSCQIALWEKVNELRDEAMNLMDYMKRAYLFVRDEITHTWDINETVVSKKASDVLRNKTGICWTKSCLLVELLRANGIPAGISYQKLTRADEDDREGYIIHVLNTVYINELNRWIRLDARGNKEKVYAEFSVDQERLAFMVRPEFCEIDYKDNHPDLDKRLCTILEESNNILQIHADFEM